MKRCADAKWINPCQSSLSNARNILIAENAFFLWRAEYTLLLSTLIQSTQDGDGGVWMNGGVTSSQRKNIVRLCDTDKHFKSSTYPLFYPRGTVGQKKEETPHTF